MPKPSETWTTEDKITLKENPENENLPTKEKQQQGHQGSSEEGSNNQRKLRIDR